MLQFDDKENKVVQINTTEPAQPLEKQPTDKMHNRYFFLAIIISFGLLLFFSLFQFFTAFLGAVIIYILSRKKMDRLVNKRGWKKNLAAVFIMLLSIIIIMVPVGIVVYLLYNKGKYYIAHPELLVASLKKVQVQIKNNYGFSVLSDENIANIKSLGTKLIKTLLNESLNFFGTFTMLYFFLYFMLMGINRLEDAPARRATALRLRSTGWALSWPGAACASAAATSSSTKSTSARRRT